jgi:hypothetical protein
MKGIPMFSKIFALVLVAGLLCAAGCSRANLYAPTNLNLVHSPRIEKKGVIVIVGLTRNHVKGDRIYIMPNIRKEGALLSSVSSNTMLNGYETQVYRTTQNENDYERWQVFTLPARPGRYEIRFSLHDGQNTYGNVSAPCDNPGTPYLFTF